MEEDRCFVADQTIDSQYLCQHKKMNLVAVFNQSGHCWRCSPPPTSSTSLKASILGAKGKEAMNRSFSEHILENL